ncbi:SNF2 family domain-containing protein [Plectosphaerella plurivora]|uniref:SNF2 family domain-containing protein n=1 Tax=Plectosphaerella plurivora TaxID=936078 RepID=A0A9P8V540_9PEZI|nr:SNF2 family domain-containing protein [Plectosphaerella plurivora]
MPRAPKKRSRPAPEVIDLTDDSVQVPAPKRHASAAHHSSQASRAAGSSQSAARGASRVYPTPAATQSSQFEEEHLDLTQDDGPPMELYGTISTKIVGVRYYNGHATMGENVITIREPSNPYDTNAIQVTNVMGHQIGHIPRTVAAKIAPYMDRGDIFIEGILAGEKQFYDCPVELEFYGPSDPERRFNLENALKQDKLLKAMQLKKTKKEAEERRKSTMNLTSSQTSIGLGNTDPDLEGMTMEELLKQSKSYEAHRDADAMKKLALDEEQLSKMPMAVQPAALRAQLLPYQLQGLAWMLSKEDPQLPKKGTKDTVQLWQWHSNGRDMVNVATKFHISGAAKLLSGGILADDMGLGKTLQIISLILAGTGSGPTLIVAPVSVMSNWEQQINRHVHPDQLPKVLIYHGSSAAQAGSLAKYDVVVTSYGKLTQQKTGGGALMSTKWRRVVLDEGHTIRNHKTNAAQAACMLTAQSRWALTGTPIVNNVGDLQSLLAFLHMNGGVEQPSIFNSVIKRPLSLGFESAEILLQNIMHDLCLRRHKEMTFVDLKLPPKTEYVHHIAFRDDEKTKYNALLDEAKGMMEKIRKGGIGKGQFQNVLERLLRLRQICNHWTLCRQRVDDLLQSLDGQDVVLLNDENKAILQEALKLFIENQEECPVCFDPLDKPVITHCKHVFCRACITKVVEIQQKCPMCRNKLGEENLLEPLPEAGEEDLDFDAESQSSKTEALLKILQATCKDPKSKVIIFSQWTSFLNIIQAQVAAAGYKYTRIDGSMRVDKRDAAISALDNEPDTRIMLASLAVCSVGLNLVSADTVVLADSWWAPAIEDQAVDRVHRLGQTRPTTVWRLVMEDSVEERVLNIQSEKRELVGKAFQEKRKGKKTKETRMADVMKLLG